MDMTVRTEITLLMREVGVPANIIGYDMLRDALEMILKEPELCHSLTGALYPQVASRHRSTPSRAERNMRHAMEVAVRKCSEGMVHLFGYERPTLGAFIATLAEELRMFRGVGDTSLELNVVQQ